MENISVIEVNGTSYSIHDPNAANQEETVNQYGFHHVEIIPSYYKHLNIDTVNKTITFPLYFMMRSMKYGNYELPSDLVVDYGSTISSSAFYVLFDWSNKTFVPVIWSNIGNYDKNTHSIVLSVRSGAESVTNINCGFAYTVNDLLYGETMRADIGMGTDYISVNTTARTITFPAKTRLIYGNKNFFIEEDTTISLQPMSITPITPIMFNPQTNELYGAKYYDKMQGILVCVVTLKDGGLNAGIDIGVPYLIDGELYGVPNMGYQNFHPATFIPPFSAYLNIDTVSKVITFPLYFMIRSEKYGVYETPKSVDVSYAEMTTSAFYVLFDWENKAFIVVSWNSIGNYDHITHSVVLSVRAVSDGMTNINCGFAYTVNGLLYGAIAPEKTQHPYDGMKMPTKRHYFDSEKFMTVSYEGSYTMNDIDIYGDYMVAGLNPDILRVYKMSDKTLVGEFPVAIHHANYLAFSNEFYADGDQFPLIYCGYENYMSVIRLTLDGATVVKTIKFDGNIGNYATPTIDFTRKVVYLYGFKHGYDADEGNLMIITMWDLTSLTENDDGTFTPALLSENKCGYLGVMQGGKYYNGIIYKAVAKTKSPFEAKLLALDAESGDVRTSIDMTGVTTSEAEGLCYQINGDNIYWYYSDYFNIFKLSF